MRSPRMVAMAMAIVVLATGFGMFVRRPTRSRRSYRDRAHEVVIPAVQSAGPDRTTDFSQRAYPASRCQTQRGPSGSRPVSERPEATDP